jgi:ABC-2 type transport system ATP-binding protein
VEVAHISKRFALRRGWLETLRHPRRRTHIDAVRGVSFSVHQGEIVGFLGANGAGKTTLLKMLSTLVIPDEGVASVMGYDLLDQPEQVRRMVAPVSPDERSLDWRLSAKENLRFFGALHGLQGQRLRDRIHEVIAAVDLIEVQDRAVGTYSSGMRQRLLIARALLSEPGVLLLDEPTRSLDPVSARAFRAFIREEIVGRQGCTVLLATHHPDEALELCDRVLIMHRGKLLAAGTAAELARRFTHDRYRVWTREPLSPCLQAWTSPNACRTGSGWEEEDGLAIVEITPPREGSDPAEILANLVFGGVHVARFEKVPLTLAGLMQNVVENGGNAVDA